MLTLGAGCLSLGTVQAENKQETASSIATHSDAEVLNSQTPKPTETYPDWMEDLASRIQLHGYAQGGFNYNHAGGVDANTFEIKRAYILANAQITDRWSFLFMHDFSSVVQEYYADIALPTTRRSPSVSVSSRMVLLTRTSFHLLCWNLLMSLPTV